MDQSRKLLVEKLNRIFPNSEIISKVELFNNEKDCSPDITLSWNDIIDILKLNGLKIVETCIM